MERERKEERWVGREKDRDRQTTTVTGVEEGGRGEVRERKEESWGGREEDRQRGVDEGGREKERGGGREAGGG